jgi:hypothetical protein
MKSVREFPLEYLYDHDEYYLMGWFVSRASYDCILINIFIPYDCKYITEYCHLHQPLLFMKDFLLSSAHSLQYVGNKLKVPHSFPGCYVDCQTTFEYVYLIYSYASDLFP